MHKSVPRYFFSNPDIYIRDVAGYDTAYHTHARSLVGVATIDLWTLVIETVAAVVYRLSLEFGNNKGLLLLSA
jgi:hypothetical protein